MGDEEAAGIAAHGSAKRTEPTDPLELRGTSVPGGDPEQLARCLIEEFAGLGYGSAQILELFRRSEYLALHAYWQGAGDEAVARLVEDVVSRCGVLRVTQADASVEGGRDPAVHGVRFVRPTAPAGEETA